VIWYATARNGKNRPNGEHTMAYVNMTSSAIAEIIRVLDNYEDFLRKVETQAIREFENLEWRDQNTTRFASAQMTALGDEFAGLHQRISELYPELEQLYQELRRYEESGY
jgi:hypothetical protein